MTILPMQGDSGYYCIQIKDHYVMQYSTQKQIESFIRKLDSELDIYFDNRQTGNLDNNNDIPTLLDIMACTDLTLSEITESVSRRNVVKGFNI